MCELEAVTLQLLFSFKSLLTCMWKLLMMPVQCLSVALFSSLKINIQRILWTLCSCEKASKAGWSPLAACANYDSCAVCLHESACAYVCNHAVASEDPDPLLILPSLMFTARAEAEWLSWREFVNLAVWHGPQSPRFASNVWSPLLM